MWGTDVWCGEGGEGKVKGTECLVWFGLVGCLVGCDVQRPHDRTMPADLVR